MVFPCASERVKGWVMDIRQPVKPQKPTLHGQTAPESAFKGEGKTDLPAQAKSLNQTLITGLILAAQVIKQLAALADHNDQTAARTVILVVRLKVPGKVLDALAEQGNLYFYRTGITLVRPEFLFNRRFGSVFHNISRPITDPPCGFPLGFCFARL
jgi:hypothetical protein